MLEQTESVATLSSEAEEELQLPPFPMVDLCLEPVQKVKRLSESKFENNPDNALLFSYLFSSPLLPLGQLQVAEEARVLKKVVKESKLNIVFRAAQCTTLEFKLRASKANIIHFSGHGSDEHGIGFEYPLRPYCEKLGEMHLVTSEFISTLRNDFKPKVVFVSACQSERIGDSFIELGVPHVIAIKRYQAVDDSAIKTFAEIFYAGLFQGRTVQTSFDMALSEIETYATSEENKILLLPQDGSVCHDVAIVDSISESNGGRMIDESPPQPVGNLPGYCHIGREDYAARIYQLLHIPRNEKSVIVLTGNPKIGKSQIALRTLNYSKDRCEFSGYYVIEGSSYFDMDSSMVPLKIVQELFELLRQDYDKSETVASKLLSRLHCSSNNVLMLHKFGQHAASHQFSHLVKHLNESTFFKVIVTVYPMPETVEYRMDKLKIVRLSDNDARKLFRVHAPDVVADISQYNGIPGAIIKAAILKTINYQYCVVVALSPTVLPQKAHNTSRDILSKHVFVEKIRSNVIKKHQLSASICSTPSNASLLAECALESQYLVYLGVGFGYEFNMGDETTSNLTPLITTTLPTVVVVCLKYGAKSFAEKLVQSPNADKVCVVLWISADIENYTVLFKMGRLLKMLTEVCLTVDLFEILPKIFDESINTGWVSGVNMLENLLTVSIASVGDGVVKVKPLDMFDRVYNNIYSEQPKSPHSFNIGHSQDLFVAAQDIEVFNSLLNYFVDENKSEATKKNVISIYPDLNNEDRHRGIVFQLIENCLSAATDSDNIIYKELEAIVAVDTEKKLTKFYECFREDNFSPFFSSSAVESVVHLTGKVLLWCDFDQLNDNMMRIISQISKNKQYLIFITLASRQDHDNLKLLNPKAPMNCITLPDSNQVNISVSVCDRHFDDILFDVSKEDGVEISMKHVFFSVQELVGKDIQVIGAYEHEDECSIVVRVSISNISALQHFFGLMMVDNFGTMLSFRLNEFDSSPPLSGDHSLSILRRSSLLNAINIRVNQTKFAECFERAMTRLENLTQHQLSIYRQCLKYSHVHLCGPAGCGKTFLAVHMIVEIMRDYMKISKKEDVSIQPIVFITRNEALCSHIVYLLIGRGIDKECIVNSFFVDYLDHKEEDIHSIDILRNGLKSVSFMDDGTVQFKHYCIQNLDKSFVIVDEAHHLFEIEVGDVFGAFACKESLLQSIIFDCFKPSKLLLLSDMSQSSLISLDEIDSLFRTERIFLKEVVRSSEKLMRGSQCYAVSHHDMRSHHEFQGLPLKTFLSDMQANVSEQDLNIALLKDALNHMKKQFEELGFGNRLMIVVPNKEVYDKYFKAVQTLIQKELNNLNIDSAVNRTSKQKEIVVYDTIDNIDGLESLIVIGFNFDQSDINNQGRSGCYRAITRAQMLFLLVGVVKEGGFFEWLKHVKYDEFMQREREGAFIDHTAIEKVFDLSSATKTVENLDENYGDEWSQSIEIDSPRMRNALERSRIEYTCAPTSSWDNSANQLKAGSSNKLVRYKPIRIKQVIPDQFGGFTQYALPFSLAAFNGNLKEVKALIESGFQYNGATPEYAMGPLHGAAEGGHLDVVQYLIEHVGIHVDERDGTGRTPLHDAAKAGQLSVAEFLIEQGAKYDAKDGYKGTPIHEAAENGHLDMVKYLLRLGSEVDESAQSGATPLNYAAKGGHFDLVQHLVELGAKYDEKENFFGAAPIHYAAQRGRLDMVKYLVELGAKVDETNKSEATPLHYAARGGHFHMVQYLVGLGAKYDEKDNNGKTPLHFAVQDGHMHIVRYLVELGAKWDVKEKFYDIAPIYHAARKGHLDMVKYLVELGAKVDEVSKNGITPLHHAAEGGHLDIVMYLVELGAKVDANSNSEYKFKKGFSPVHDAIKNGHLDVVRYLLKFGVKLDEKNVGATIKSLNDAAESGHLDMVQFMVEELTSTSEEKHQYAIVSLRGAAKFGRLNVVKYLIELGIKCDEKSQDGSTPLHAAASMGCLGTVQYLVERGANYDEKDMNGSTPLHKAVQGGTYLHVVRYLVEKGAKVDGKNKNGRTPLHEAAKIGFLDVVQYLVEEVGVVCDDKDKNGHTPLSLAKKAEVIQFLSSRL